MTTQASHPEAAGAPDGAPSWVTPDLLEETLRAWKPYYGRTLTIDEAAEILRVVGLLFDLLEEDDE